VSLYQAPSPPNALVATALASYCFGFFFLHTSDAQKYFTLRLRPGLITDGFFSRTRNPNYFGELLIYTGFALMASGANWHLWLVPWIINLLVWFVLFVPNWYDLVFLPSPLVTVERCYYFELPSF
jgi:steroid 5-alpha reductase family enzyme